MEPTHEANRFRLSVVRETGQLGTEGSPQSATFSTTRMCPPGYDQLTGGKLGRSLLGRIRADVALLPTNMLRPTTPNVKHSRQNF